MENNALSNAIDILNEHGITLHCNHNLSYNCPVFSNDLIKDLYLWPNGTTCPSCYKIMNDLKKQKVVKYNKHHEK